MNPKLLVLPEALSDMEKAADWYGERSELLRFGFLADLESRISHIIKFPEAAPIHRGKIRRVLFGKFPHGVFYVADKEVIKILAVLHLKQRPDQVGKR